MSSDIFESHVTVRCDNQQQYSRFFEVCTEIGVKGIRIELDGGIHPEHAITGKYHRGVLSDVQQDLFGIGKKLEDYGYAVLRYKVEAASLDNPLVPVTTEQMQARPDFQYFEFHFKVGGYLTSQHLEVLKVVCGDHNAHLSRTASSRRHDGYQHRFVTTRYRTSKQQAIDLESQLLADIRQNGFTDLSNFLKEFTVWDTNLEQDRGWSH